MFLLQVITASTDKGVLEGGVDVVSEWEKERKFFYRLAEMLLTLEAWEYKISPINSHSASSEDSCRMMGLRKPAWSESDRMCMGLRVVHGLTQIASPPAAEKEFCQGIHFK
ncbi:hypothetical protein H0G86_002280 [Trichoderma simmonsii]|uniref:Uncharacterized protein n=1 Tax=Trichoderma simmonsii TaxID=1491479 RepID=A0A8G0L6B3_9HYPO|nr:hypothetical protein H0G86_002280 [Trichoderma simmonsii]